MEPRQQLKIVVIEDEPVFRAILVAQLRSRGDLVYEADNGVDGLAAVVMFQPELVLCDLQMPRMDGHQVIACINRRYPRIPIMVVSGHANMGDVTRALRFGAKDYLLKPIRDWKGLHASIDDCLRNAEDEQEMNELQQHLRHFSRDDLASSQLLQAMLPPVTQLLGKWQVGYDSETTLLLPEFFPIGERLLVVITELSLLNSDATFIGAMIKFLLHGPYRQYLQGESHLFNAPGQVLEYLNWHLFDSGLKGCVNTAVMLFSPREDVCFANAGLTSPHWLQSANGLPLGLVRQSDYPSFQRVAKLPFCVPIRGEDGGELVVRVDLEA